MKIKLVVSLVAPVLVMLGSAGCVTNSNSYSRDIVYRDGSYYSPADEQNGDYYYEPEPDYSYYDDYAYYGFNSGYYGNSWYGSGYSSPCRFSYRYDRYCYTGWGNSFLNFGGLTIIFGNSNHYDYGYGYGYAYPRHDYYGHSPYYGWNSPGRQPGDLGATPMPKPTRPIISRPDYGFNNGPGMRVPGERTRIPLKPGEIEQSPDQEVLEAQDRQTLNPYARTRQPGRNIRPEIWRNSNDANVEDGIVINNGRRARPVVGDSADPRRQNEPGSLIEANDYQLVEKPIRQNRQPQPYPRALGVVNDAQPGMVVESSGSPAPERIRREYRQDRPEPRRERVERVERVERSERSERPGGVARQENTDDGGGNQ